MDFKLIEKEITIEEKIYDSMPKFYKKKDVFDFNFNPEVMIKETMMREKFVQMGMFGFVSWKWINPFSEWIGNRKCLEVMAGRGWLSYALRQKDIDVIATDNYSWARNLYKQWNDTVTEVEELDAIESIEKYASSVDIVIMSWAYMDNTAYQVLKRLKEVNPNAILVFIGEGAGGCTADDDFYESFDILEDYSFYKNVASNYERWESIHDRICIGRMRE